MESSRDSSVWRSLAVTFGGGLALGAVGMKITQSALRPIEIPVRPDFNPVTDRLSRMEQRLERVEQVPPQTTTPAAAPLDQKVLEAVVGAVDARLHEHTAQVDRRLADMEARITVELQSLHQQDRHLSEVSVKDIAELQRQSRQEVANLRAAIREELSQFGESVSKTVADQAAQAHARATALEQSVETRIVTAAAAAVAAQFERELVPLRAQVAHKERELAELRHRLTESEGAVLDVILAIGQVCRQASQRIAGAPEARVAAGPQAEPVVETPAPEVPGAPLLAVVPIAPNGTAPAAHSAAEEPVLPDPEPAPALEAAPPPAAVGRTLDTAIPDFLQSSTPGRWRIPLVSSFLVTTGVFWLLHYL
jgi:hypothetical protein